MSEVLKACPFCGGEPVLTMIGNEHTKSRSTKIKCSDCQVARTIGAIRHSHEWTREKAVAAWNRRSTAGERE